MQVVKSDVLIDTLNDDLNAGHDNQLREAGFAEHSSERDEHGGWAKVCYQETKEILQRFLKLRWEKWENTVNFFRI